MAITDQELRTVQLERLRAILIQLEAAQKGPRHKELLERARILVAEVRTTREALALARAARH